MVTPSLSLNSARCTSSDNDPLWSQLIPPPELSSPFRFSLYSQSRHHPSLRSHTKPKRVRVRLYFSFPFPLVFSRHRILLHLFITFILPSHSLCTLSHPLPLPLRIHDYDYRDDYFSTIHRSLWLCLDLACSCSCPLRIKNLSPQ